MKYKKLTLEQIIISLDRLTRFKSTKEKYFRVFSDILITNLIEPKLKKSDIQNLDYKLIADYVSEIFNNSLEESITLPVDFSINNILRDYENTLFINDDETQKLLNNSINYVSAINLIQKDSPVNLKWLSAIINYPNIPIKQIRQDLLCKHPIEMVVLVEGITEDILLPSFARFIGFDFYANGIQVIAAGRKNQVVKMYYKLAKELKIPIFVLLDKDAEDNIAQINPRLRDNDRIHLVSCGEFEDLLPKTLIIKTVNSHFKNFLSISEKDLLLDLPTAKVLEEIFKTKGLHEFKKAEFAKLVREEIKTQADISPEILTIVEEIKLINKVLDTKICS